MQYGESTNVGWWGSEMMEKKEMDDRPGEQASSPDPPRHLPGGGIEWFPSRQTTLPTAC